MSPLRRLARAVLGRLAARKMDRFYARGEDPYGFGASAYDLRRLGALEAALGTGPYRHALEIGASQGEFTARLAPKAARVTALEVSSLAVERARARLAGLGGLDWVCADLRGWEPPEGRRYDLLVVSEVLYYLDKRFARGELERQFGRLAGWLEPGGTLLLAHGFVKPEQRERNLGYRRRFEALGLTLVAETHVPPEPGAEPVQSLISTLRKD